MGQEFDDRRIGARFRAGARDVHILYIIQTGSEASPTSYPKGMGVISTGLKRPGREAIIHLHVMPILRMP
jgi:hypothetical protein